MDELQMVREAYGEPTPPTLREMTEARAAMFGKPPRTRVRFGWRLKAGVGVVAVGAATAVAIAAVGSGSPAPPSPHAAVDLDKKAVLAAAEKAEAQPTGKYWYSDSFDGQSYVIRAKTGTYAITAASSESFNWTGAKSGMGEAYFNRDLPARPATARDEALWRKAGSPSTFRVRGDGRYITYTTRAPKWRSSGPEVGTNPDGGGQFVGPGPGPATLEDLQKLPTDPAKLAKLFLGSGQGDPSSGNPSGADPSGAGLSGADPSGRRGSGPGNSYAQIWRTASVLGGPIPPKVRAGLMRALAAQPGLRAIGRATDPLGRTGVALATADRAETSYRARDVIIFDRHTGALLSVQHELTKPGGEYAEMKPGFVINYKLDRSSGWTNTKPKPPAELPF
ncbi:CU044_5270 family protein [Spirillospora sp. CA-128828]|uniref:CU044_5270 family protein n=1 Tax=Spirillospora sp. CA-128828 TaxID=3240033 RepID=UPI003D8BD224